MSDQERKAKQAVLAVYPDARCVQIVRGKWNIVYGDDPNNIGYANILEPPHLSQSAAWIDAASRLAPTREVEPQQQAEGQPTEPWNTGRAEDFYRYRHLMPQPAEEIPKAQTFEEAYRERYPVYAEVMTTGKMRYGVTQVVAKDHYFAAQWAWAAAKGGR